jgi:hypothetical protein
LSRQELEPISIAANVCMLGGALYKFFCLKERYTTKMTPRVTSPYYVVRVVAG